MMPEVVLTHDDGVAVITLSRPDRLNAINIPLRDAFLGALGRIAATPDIHCVVLRAEGRFFCAGQDLEERRPIIEGQPLDLGEALRSGINRMIIGVRQLRQPVVCALQGDAVGAGASLALACDMLLASEDARLHFSFARLGLGPDGGASWLLAKRVGHARAAELLLLARPIGARQAEAWGIINSCHAGQDLEPSVAAVARRMASLPSDALAAGKSLLSTALDGDLSLQLEAEASSQSVLGTTTVYKDNLRAFFQRHK